MIKNSLLLSRVLAAGFILFASANTAAAMNPEENLKAIERHDQAVHVMDEWMRDPYIYLAKDGYYYMTCTTTNYIKGGVPGIGVWRSEDLANWENLSPLWTVEDSSWMQPLIPVAESFDRQFHIWAPEIHFFDGRWVVVFTSSGRRSNIIFSQGEKLEGPFSEPFGYDFDKRHDPAFFTDDDGTRWLLYARNKIIKMSDDLESFAGEPIDIGPSNRKIGHEGLYMIKVSEKYALFGTGWSTDKMRHGSYNLYYCTGDSVTGPFGPRKFAARFCGHGTPFQDKKGRWWTTAFLNGNDGVPRVDGSNATMPSDPVNICKLGMTLVPLEIGIGDDGDVVIKAKDSDYAEPGPEEVQQF